MQGLNIILISGLCPVQGEGTFDGNPFYFRARHGVWGLYVTTPDADPVDASLGWAPALHAAEGDDPSCGYMEESAVKAILEAEYQAFLAGGNPKEATHVKPETAPAWLQMMTRFAENCEAAGVNPYSL